MFVLNRAKPVLPPAPPTAVSTTNLGCPAPSDTSSHTLSSGAGQSASPILAPNKQQQLQQQEGDIRTMRRMAGEGGEAEPVISSETEGMFLNHTGLFMDSQIAYEIHCWKAADGLFVWERSVQRSLSHVVWGSQDATAGVYRRLTETLIPADDSSALTDGGGLHIQQNKHSGWFDPKHCQWNTAALTPKCQWWIGWWVKRHTLKTTQVVL